MTVSVRYPSNSNFNKQIKKLASESEDFPTYNIFKIIASICIACVSKICKYLPTPSVPTLVKTCKRKPCHCNECIDYLYPIENDRIELRLLYENKCRNELDHDKCKNNNCRPYPAHNCSNIHAKSTTYKPWQQMPGKNPTPRSRKIDLKQLSQLGVLGSPIEKCIQDMHSASVENNPLIIQGKHADVHDPICDKVLYICGRCECKNKSQFEQYLGDNLEQQKEKCTGSSMCKCSLCECLSCPLQKEATFAESVESFKTSAVRDFVENEWNSRLRGNEQEIQACRTAKEFRHFRDCDRIIVDKSSDEKYFANCSKHDHGRKPCQCNTLQDQRMFSKMPVKEMLDNIYAYDRDYGIEENDKNMSTVNQNQPLKNKYGVYTTENHETNTENFTADKCIDTVNLSANKKQCIENKVKNYEYTLKIEIITPSFDDNTKQAMKQRIKRTSKKKIKEQTQKVMKDVIKDISKNSLIHDMYVEEIPNALQLSDCKTFADTESHERNKRRSILKKMSLVSVTSTTTEKQDSLQMITTLPRRTGSKIEDFIVSCVTPLQNTSLNTGKVIDANKSEVPSKDESVLSQNYCSPVPPAPPSTMRPVDEVVKLISCVDAAIDVKKSSTYLDDLRVQEPCVRRVSHHTVSLKWKLPKLIKEIIGYEILVDGRTIEKIINPKRCLAVVSCLPPVRRLMITIRTLPKNPDLHGLYPCTTVGYQPRANKFIRI